MSQREYAEDTIFWSIKDARQFSARRRTVVLFHTNTSTLAGRPNPIIWIDNTGDVWPELRSILHEFNPARIALNTDRSIAFGGGLHVGEYDVLNEELGEKWMQRTVNEPMLGIEFVAKRVPGQIEYYRKMQESIWAMIEEGFSEKVVQPGITTTAVSERELCSDALGLTYWCDGSIGRRVVVHGKVPRPERVNLEPSPASPSSRQSPFQAGPERTPPSKRATFCTSTSE